MRILGACAILVNSHNQILLGKRKNGYKAGLYGLPGGIIELNEKILAAITREVVEETDVSGLDFEFVGVVRENQGGYDFIHFVFSATIGDQQPKLCEREKCEGWEWFDQDLNFVQVLPGHSAAIELFLKKEKLADLTLEPH